MDNSVSKRQSCRVTCWALSEDEMCVIWFFRYLIAFPMLTDRGRHWLRKLYRIKHTTSSLQVIKKVKDLDIYIPPLTGKPRPAAVYNWSGVLTGNDTSGAAQVATTHCPNERTLDPAVMKAIKVCLKNNTLCNMQYLLQLQVYLNANWCMVFSSQTCMLVAV